VGHPVLITVVILARTSLAGTLDEWRHGCRSAIFLDLLAEPAGQLTNISWVS
jgi:hypothetical protein